jgi:hypothetical protein
MNEARKNMIDRMNVLYGEGSPVSSAFAEMCAEITYTDEELEYFVKTNEGLITSVLAMGIALNL